jgi:phenylalanyl-tRNA synthetase beta chain
MTISVVDAATSDAMTPWTDAPALATQMPILRGADRLRRSLVPSLLAARRTNEALANNDIELFEMAKVYLPQPTGLPREERMLAVTSGRGYLHLKGLIESLIAAVRPKWKATLDVAPIAPLDPNAACRFVISGEMLGYVGELSAEGLRQFDLRGAAAVAELRLSPLIDAAELVPQYQPLPAFPAVARDINLVVDQAVRWSDLAATATGSAGDCLERLEYRDTYRDAKRLGADKKSLLFSVHLRSSEGTLTSQQADDIRERIVAACRERHGAELRA